jgi:taurine dioxygenase
MPETTRLDLNVKVGDREVIHPLVCHHPRSGAKHLFLNRTYSQRIDGISNEESGCSIDAVSFRSLFPF